MSLCRSPTTFTAALLSLFFPPRCLGCRTPLSGQQLPSLCPSCLAKSTFCGHPCCLTCGTPLPAGDDHHCGICLRGYFAFDRARSALLYAPPVDGMIHDLKFRGQLNVLSSMACLIERSGVLSEFTVPDLILPVPLHTARLRERGYNQALLLARALFPGPYRRRIAPFILQRHRYTAAQSQLTGRTRRQNLRGAFCLSSQQSIAGTAVLLIDDVFTTGATLHECAKVLKQGGCTTVEALSFARSLGAPANSAATT